MDLIDMIAQSRQPERTAMNYRQTLQKSLDNLKVQVSLYEELIRRMDASPEICDFIELTKNL